MHKAVFLNVCQVVSIRNRIRHTNRVHQFPGRRHQDLFLYALLYFHVHFSYGAAQHGYNTVPPVASERYSDGWASLVFETGAQSVLDLNVSVAITPP